MTLPQDYSYSSYSTCCHFYFAHDYLHRPSHEPAGRLFCLSFDQIGHPVLFSARQTFSFTAIVRPVWVYPNSELCDFKHKGHFSFTHAFLTAPLHFTALFKPAVWKIRKHRDISLPHHYWLKMLNSKLETGLSTTYEWHTCQNMSLMFSGCWKKNTAFAVTFCQNISNKWKTPTSNASVKHITMHS